LRAADILNDVAGRDIARLYSGTREQVPAEVREHDAEWATKHQGCGNGQLIAGYQWHV